MSEVFQSGRHPDADQLSAFVEHALPTHEREATLAHLAVCPECRTIAALSASATEAPQKHTETPSRKMWLRGWNLAWASVAVSAVLALVIVFAYSPWSNHRRQSQLAETQVTKPAPSNPQTGQAQEPATASTQQKLPAHRKQTTPQEERGNVLARNQLHEATPKLPPPNHKQSGIAGADAEVALQNVLQQPTAIRSSRTPQTPSTLAKANPRPLAARGQTVGGLLGGIGHGEGLGTGSQPTPSGAANHLASDALLQGAPPVHPLPSGLPVLSFAARGSKMLAIDTAHSLFLSTDSGIHWKAVAAPWKSHPVKVSLVSFHPPSSQAQGVAGAGGIPTQPSFITGANPAKLQSIKNPATIKGRVFDPTGSPIPDATVVVTQAAIHVSHVVRTDSQGRYIVPDLAPGTYTVEARSLGFMTESIPAVSATASAQAVVNLTLRVSAASQSVTVAPPPQPKTSIAPPPTHPEHPTKAGAPSVFEITTQDGVHWISSDGLTWKRK